MLKAERMIKYGDADLEAEELVSLDSSSIGVDALSLLVRVLYFFFSAKQTCSFP